MNKQRKHIRGRIRFTFFLMMTVIISVAGINTLLGLNNANGQTKSTYITVEVVSGDTLWTIAENYMPDDMDPREAVYQIKRANGLEQSKISSGEQLRIPTNHFD